MSGITRVSKSSAVESSHPSVRIRGTENDYSPKICVDSRCIYNVTVHMHCPFCMKTDLFYDDKILKAHYSVKHVDKGIEFAGLKILRCCKNCDIVGIIKEEKKFKGAHWHCYKCRNGFKRRDEAIKHYKTHFKQPYSTFQIHITQEVNSRLGYQESKEDDLNPLQDTIKDYVAKDAGTSSQLLGTPVILKSCDASLYSDALEEYSPELSSTDLLIENNNNNSDEQTEILIIQEQECQDVTPHMVNNSEENLMQQKIHLEQLVGKLQNQILDISQNKTSLEMKLRGEIQYLKKKVNSQSEEIKRLHQTLADLSANNELSSSETCPKMQTLIETLQEQHTRLLLEHLQQVRSQTYSASLQQLKAFNFNPNKVDATCKSSQLHSHSSMETDQGNYRNELDNSSPQIELPTVPRSESEASTSYLTVGSLFRGVSAETDNGDQMTAEQNFRINAETNSMTAFIIDRDNANSVDTSVDGSCLSRSYFIVSQDTGRPLKRGFEEVQSEEESLMSKDCKCDP